MPAKPLPPEALVELLRRLSALPSRSPAKRQVIQEAATVYDVSEVTIYRAPPAPLSFVDARGL
jgi:hypothetical protein